MKRKTSILTARLTPAEKAAIERKAKQSNMTVTDYIVKCALDKNVLPTQDLEPILSELKAQGRNLNQLTKRVHETGRIYEADLEDISQRQEQLWAGMKEILTQLSKLS